MNIIQLNGEERQLYDSVAHLVMNKEVLAFNNNYPFKTSSDHTWFIATEDHRTIGFIPVELKSNKAVINNYYIEDDDNQTLTALLNEIVNSSRYSYPIESVTHTRHMRLFEKHGFSVMLHWEKYVKMRYADAEKKRL